MGAEQVGGELPLQLAARNAAERAVNAETAVIEQTVQSAVGQRDHLGGGALDAGAVVQIQLDAFQPELAHVFHVLRLAAGGQHPVAAVAQILRRNQANPAGTAGYQYRFLHNFT